MRVRRPSCHQVELPGAGHACYMDDARGFTAQLLKFAKECREVVQVEGFDFDGEEDDPDG